MDAVETGLHFLDAAALRPKAARFPLVWLEDARAGADLSYSIKGVLAEGLAVIYGPSGDGKTFFTLDAAAHIAGGIPWRGRRVRRGLVVYVAAEAGASILRRFYAWRERAIGESSEGRIPLAILTRGVNLLDPVAVTGLLDELRAIATEAGLALALVVFDTLSRSMQGGDENSAADMTDLVAAADRIRDELSAGVVLVHHSGKDTTKGARGHSSLFAAADCVISVVERCATIEKSRDGLQGEKFPFALDVVDLGLDTDGDPLTTCVVRHLDETEPGRRPAPKLSGVARLALQALGEAIEAHGRAMPQTSTIPAGVRAVTLDQWRTAFRTRYGTDHEGTERAGGTLQKAFVRAREQLAESVAVSNPYVWITR